jgi:hypothetical protein
MELWHIGGMKLTDIRCCEVAEFVADQTKAGRGTVTGGGSRRYSKRSSRVLSKMS